ncbi:hypothetical protein GCM10007285_33860 [Stappia taiwanensis]|nr:hypothetical protein GCM10007285_33860 [Stappia taiwanensis]
MQRGMPMGGDLPVARAAAHGKPFHMQHIGKVRLLRFAVKAILRGRRKCSIHPGLGTKAPFLSCRKPRKIVPNRCQVDGEGLMGAWFVSSGLRPSAMEGSA